MYRLVEARGWPLVGIALVLSTCLTLGHPEGTRARPAPTSPPVVSFGVNMHPLQWHYDIYGPAQTLRLANEVGASVVRIDIHWEWIEYAGAGARFWDAQQVQALDAFLAEAARRHIRVLATVVDTPCWASSEPDKQCPPAPPHYFGRYPPTSPQDYARFLTRLIRHVGRKIQYYEIWNEPNVERFWANPDPVAYTKLLRAAYRAIKAQDPRAQVLAGATSGADVSFVNRMYEAGAKGYFDALSIHPYSGSQPPDACSAPRSSFRCGVEQVRRVMLHHGDTRPIWLTEFGESVAGGVDPSTQASYLTQAFSLIRHWSYVRGAVWYELYDDPSGHDGEHFGLFEGTLCPRPAASAFRSSVWATKTPTGTLRCPESGSAARGESPARSHSSDGHRSLPTMSAVQPNPPDKSASHRMK